MSKSTPWRNSLQTIPSSLQQLTQQLSKIQLMALFRTNSPTGSSLEKSLIIQHQP